MKKGKLLGTILLLLIMALSVFLLLIIPKEYGPAIWITLCFDVIAFGSQLLLLLILFKGENDPKEVFYRTPSMVVSTIYLCIQFCICIVTGIFGASMNTKLILSINFIVMIMAWIVLVPMLFSKDHIQKVDSRQKDHHIQL